MCCHPDICKVIHVGLHKKIDGIAQTLQEMDKENTIRYATRKTNRSIDIATQSIQGYNITLTTTEDHEAINEATIITHMVLTNEISGT